MAVCVSYLLIVGLKRRRIPPIRSIWGRRAWFTYGFDLTNVTNVTNVHKMESLPEDLSLWARANRWLAISRRKTRHFVSKSYLRSWLHCSEALWTVTIIYLDKNRNNRNGMTFKCEPFYQPTQPGAVSRFRYDDVLNHFCLQSRSNLASSSKVWIRPLLHRFLAPRNKIARNVTLAQTTALLRIPLVIL